MDPVVVLPGRKHLGNVELRARTADTARFTFGIVEIAYGRELAPHVHAVEDDAAYAERARSHSSWAIDQ
jgi:hypothetical protein